MTRSENRVKHKHKEKFESCVQYDIKSHPLRRRGERELRLTIHFQESQFPPRRVDKKPQFDYQIKSARLTIELHNARMPLINIEPVSEFPLHDTRTIKKSSSGERSSNISGKFDSQYSGEAASSLNYKHTTSINEEFTQYKPNIDYMYDSDTSIYWRFRSNDVSNVLKGTLKEYLLGRLSNCATDARALTSMEVFEKDIVANPPPSLSKLGIIGFVIFKYQRSYIAKEMSEESRKEIIL